jgi:hypothetical protein
MDHQNQQQAPANPEKKVKNQYFHFTMKKMRGKKSTKFFPPAVFHYPFAETSLILVARGNDNATNNSHRTRPPGTAHESESNGSI